MEKEEKLRLLNEYYGLALAAGKARTQTDFANLLGIHRSSLSMAFQGRDDYLTDRLIARAAKVIDQLSLADTFPRIGDAAPIKEKTIPVIPTGARAGTLVEFIDGVQEYECERIISPIRGADYAIQVTGDSMSPEYPNGSIVLIKKIDEKAFIEWGKVYVLDTENGAVIKQIRNTPKEGVVECVSLNPNYQPFTINTDYIQGWYRVLMCLSLK